MSPITVADLHFPSLVVVVRTFVNVFVVEEEEWEEAQKEPVQWWTAEDLICMQREFSEFI